MDNGGRQTLSQFGRKIVASEDEWLEWQTIKDAAAPKVHTRMSEPTALIPFYHEEEQPSAEYVRRRDLRRVLIAGVRHQFGTGLWEISGRLGAPSSRQKLECVDWDEAVIDFDRNAIGHFTHVEVRHVRAETNREILQRFIELICEAAGTPGRALSLTVIRDIAMRMYPDVFTAPDFAVAAKEANIADEWHQPGRKRGNSKFD